MDRRHFLKASAMFSAGGLLGSNPIQSHGDGAKKITIRTLSLDGVKTRLAARELLSGLRALKSPGIIVETAESGTAFEITLTVDASRFKQTEDYEIARTSRGAAFHASTEQALLYAVFDFLDAKARSSASMAQWRRSTPRTGCICQNRVSRGTLRHALVCEDCCRGRIFSTASAFITTRISKHILPPCYACA